MMETVLEKLNEIVQSNKLTNDKIDKLAESVDFLNEKYEQIRVNLKKAFDNQEVLNKSITKLQKENKVLKENVIALSERVEKLEAGALASSLNLYPVIITNGEDLKSVVMKIGNKIGVNIKEEDIVSVYRRPNRKNGNPGDVVLKCSTPKLRDCLLEGVKKMKLTHKALNLIGKFDRIYANEEMTSEGKDLYFSALKIKKDKKWKYIWVKAGRTYVRKADGENAIRVDSLDTLSKIS